MKKSAMSNISLTLLNTSWRERKDCWWIATTPNMIMALLKGGVTIFNILTISSVGIGMGGKRFLKNDFKKSQKIVFNLF